MECLIEGCVSVMKNRGVCQTHYVTLLRKVNRGEITWHQLEGFGMSVHTKRAPKGLVEKQLNKVMHNLNRSDSDQI